MQRSLRPPELPLSRAITSGGTSDARHCEFNTLRESNRRPLAGRPAVRPLDQPFRFGCGGLGRTEEGGRGTPLLLGGGGVTDLTHTDEA